MKSSKILRCNTCGRFLSEDDFYWTRKNKKYRKSECIRCGKNYSAFRCKYNKLYYLKNKTRIDKRIAQYSMYNIEKIRIRKKQYRKSNKDKFNSLNAKRRTNKLNQHDPTTNTEEVAKLYKLSSVLTKDFRPYHVDHIITVYDGGSSHENNLQVITRKQNLEKGSNSNSNLKGITIHNIRNHPEIFNTIIGA